MAKLVHGTCPICRTILYFPAEGGPERLHCHYCGAILRAHRRNGTTPAVAAPVPEVIPPVVVPVVVPYPVALPAPVELAEPAPPPAAQQPSGVEDALKAGVKILSVLGGLMRGDEAGGLTMDASGAIDVNALLGGFDGWSW
jgi:hypothetical protein